MGFTHVTHQSHPCSCKTAFYSTNGEETEGCASHAFKDGWHLGSTTVFYSTMNPECMHGRGSLSDLIPHKAKRTLEVFPLIISSPFRHLHTIWEVFQYMGHYKWIGVVAYLFLSKLFSGLPLVLCDMPCKSACWELTISHWAHNSEALLQLSCYNVVFDFKWMTLCASKTSITQITEN